MEKTKIIPAIDLINGKCVRLSKGDYATEKVYHENPIEMAQFFESLGAKQLHVVDLDGAKAGSVQQWKVVEQIASQTKLKIDFGGGIKTSDDVQRVLDAGVSQLTAGSIAVKNPTLVKEWIQKWGNEKIILGADIQDAYIAINAWTEASSLRWQDFIQDFVNEGVKYVVSTDISKDGMLQGPSLNLYKEMQDIFPSLNIVASGGVSKMEDVEQLNENGIYAVIVGKAIYEEKISSEELKQWFKSPPSEGVKGEDK
jgi:phosphoribosylformimino-5-aminoimidazole carboxamide ribotide isomerase